MSRIDPVDPRAAQGKAQQLLADVQKKLGRTPNLIRVFAHSPAALEGYLGLSGALGQGLLAPELREQIALTVGEINQCTYCISAHTAIARMVGLDDSAIVDARSARARDPKSAAILALARSLVVERGRLTDRDLAAARDAGIGDGELVEVVAQVALNLLTNYLNHVADTVVDFPRAPALAEVR